MKFILKNESFVTLTTQHEFLVLITKVQYDKKFSEFVSIFCKKEHRSSRHTKDAIILVLVPCIFPKQFVTYNFAKKLPFKFKTLFIRKSILI
jgi:hypothetical protein